MNYTDPTMDALEAAKQTGPRGGEYWRGRDIQKPLGYDTWENFANGAIKRAMEACAKSGQDPINHFREITKMVEVGSGAKVKAGDYALDRYACYLIAMNGDPGKPEIAAAQRYFAVQTRLRELDQKALAEADRLELRDRLKVATKALNSAAKSAGVQNYALFADAGYRGLYEMGLADVKRRKGLSDKEELFDRAGGLELAANEFRARLAEKSISEKRIRGQQSAEQEHRRVGGVVRQTVKNETGVCPEDLPAEPSIKKLAAASRKKLKQGDSTPELL